MHKQADGTVILPCRFRISAFFAAIAIVLSLCFAQTALAATGTRSIVSASGVADSRRPIQIESSAGRFNSKPIGLTVLVR